MGLMLSSTQVPAHAAVFSWVKGTPWAANMGINGMNPGAGPGAGPGYGPGAGAHMPKNGIYGVVLKKRTGCKIGAGVAGIGNVTGTIVGAGVTAYH